MKTRDFQENTEVLGRENTRLLGRTATNVRSATKLKERDLDSATDELYAGDRATISAGFQGPDHSNTLSASKLKQSF